MKRQIILGLLLLCGFATVVKAQSNETAEGAESSRSKFLFQGTVSDENGKGISGVVVNNGVDFTKTDKEGRWTLLTDTCLSKIISLSTPAGYNLPQQGIAKGFYVSTRQLCVEKSHEFVLTKRKKKSKEFYLIEISDPQVKTDAHMKRWTAETIPDLRHTVDFLGQKHEVVAIILGDLVWDNMPLMDAYAASCKDLGMTIFSCIGNHDFNLKYDDLHNMPYGTPVYAERDYEEHFGPVNYSFNIGRLHVVTLKNINYMANRKYVEELTPAGMQKNSRMHSKTTTHTCLPVILISSRMSWFQRDLHSTTSEQHVVHGGTQMSTDVEHQTAI